VKGFARKPRPAAEPSVSHQSGAANVQERAADTAGAAFDRDAPLAAGHIRPGPLSYVTRRAAEQALGASLPDVRVHIGGDAAMAVREAEAAAFTAGTDVFMGDQRAPGRSADRRLLAHELAHVVQQRREGASVQRAPQTPPSPSGYPTISQVLTDDGTAFRPEYPDLQQRYEHYRLGRTNPAPPGRWVKLARDSNRTALLAVLGPNLGDEVEPDNPNEADVLRLSELQRPAGYSQEQLRADLELLRRYPGALDARLTKIPQDQLQLGEFSGGYARIAAGNVGEALAEPVLQLRLAQLRAQYPDAQIFRNLRMRVPIGSAVGGGVQLSQPLLFSDGLIARVTGSGLSTAGLMFQILYVQEVKSGGHGGQEGTEQVFEWIEGRLGDGARLVLEDGREFEYNPVQAGGVRGLMSAPRGLVTGLGVGHLGAAGSMGVAATVDRIELARTPAQMRYLAGLLLQSIWAREQLRRLQENQRTAYEAKSPADFADPEIAQKILAEHSGLAVASGRLYQLRSSGGELSISERPVVSFAFVYPPGTKLPGQAPALPPGSPLPAQLGPGSPPTAPAAPQPQLPPGTPQTMPQLPPPVTPVMPVMPQLPAGQGGPGPAAVPQLGPGTSLLAPMPVIGSSQQIQAGAVPATELDEWLPRVGSLGGAEWLIWNGTVRDGAGRPITGFQDGEIWVRVIGPGGTPLPEIDPATGSPAPSVRAMTPEGPRTFQATPYESPSPRAPSTATRGVAGAMGIIMVVNELLGPIAATRDVQRMHNLRMQALVHFFTEFGAEPHWAVEDLDKPPGAPLLPWQTEQGIGAVWGAWRAARITSLNVPAFMERLPERLTSFQSLVLFLSTARSLGVIEQDGTRYFLTLPGVTYTEITSVIERVRSERLREVDAASRADLVAKGGEGIYRIKAGAKIYRYAEKVREHHTLLSFQASVLTAPEFLGSNAWVRDVGDQGKYPSRSGRLHVEPANAEAAGAAQSALYIVHKSIESVYREVQAEGRQITSRQPPDGTLQSFTAAPFPPELGATIYQRHPYPDSADIYTVASGQLLQFWVDRDDLEAIPAAEVSGYARGTAAAPPPSRLFTTEKRQDLPIM
jgi:hypothetical protein